jgi:hypothetical protein
MPLDLHTPQTPIITEHWSTSPQTQERRYSTKAETRQLSPREVRQVLSPTKILLRRDLRKRTPSRPTIAWIFILVQPSRSSLIQSVSE